MTPEKTDSEGDLRWELHQLRDAVGRWQKGVSGNPVGRPRGSKNRATLLAQALLEATSDILTQKAIEKALTGDSVSLRFILARILAPRRTPPVEFDLPPLHTQQDLALGMAAIGKAVAEGEITPAEAVDLSRFIESASRTIEAREDEFSTNHFWGRKRAPAAPPLPSTDPAPEASETSGAASPNGEPPRASGDADDETAVSGSSLLEPT